jgi:hypothetical protein
VTIGLQCEKEIAQAVCALPDGCHKLLDLSIGQKVFYATIYSQRFHTLYFTEAGERRKTRENIGDFVGFRSDSKHKKHFVTPPRAFHHFEYA